MSGFHEALGCGGIELGERADKLYCKSERSLVVFTDRYMSGNCKFTRSHLLSAGDKNNCVCKTGGVSSGEKLFGIGPRSAGTAQSLGYS